MSRKNGKERRVGGGAWGVEERESAHVCVDTGRGCSASNDMGRKSERERERASEREGEGMREKERGARSYGGDGERKECEGESEGKV